MPLFENVDQLRQSGYLFRIVDNGGETHDRITVTFCDGDGLLCSAYGVCTSIERVDVQIDADRVQAGVDRDLRWIDLDADLRSAILRTINQGFSDWLDAAPAAPDHDSALDWEGIWEHIGAVKGKTAIYRDGAGFRIRDDDNAPVNPDQTGEGLFDSFVEAVRYALPQDYDLSGPEYHTTVDLWDDTDPKPYWDRSEEPPVIDEGSEFARACICLEQGNEETKIAWFATVADAEAYLATSATIDPDLLDAGAYTINDLDAG